MFVLIDGIMGSGKTYYAVHRAYKSMQNYYKVYTNVNEFKYQYNIYQLKWSWLYNHLVSLYEIYDNDDTNDSDLLSYLIENDIIGKNEERILIVLDEAHNQFDKKDDILTWFITYHRHLYIDVLLITQSYSLINREYYKLMEYFIHAVPASRRLVASNFRYKKYMAVPFSDKDTFVGAETLSFDDTIFSLYGSGDKVKVKSFVRKYVIYAVLIFSFTVILFFIFIKTFFSPSDSEVSKVTSNSVSQKNIFAGNYVSYIQVKCIDKKCIFGGKKIVYNDFEYLIKLTNSRLVSRKVFGSSYVELSLLVTSQFLTLIKGDLNEKNNAINFLK